MPSKYLAIFYINLSFICIFFIIIFICHTTKMVLLCMDLSFSFRKKTPIILKIHEKKMGVFLKLLPLSYKIIIRYIITHHKWGKAMLFHLAKTLVYPLAYAALPLP